MSNRDWLIAALLMLAVLWGTVAFLLGYEVARLILTGGR